MSIPLSISFDGTTAASGGTGPMDLSDGTLAPAYGDPHRLTIAT
jgi:hypothetical protein